MSQEINDQLVLISGESATGKSASLRNLRNPEGVVHLNCESGKRLPFPNKFISHKIIDPYQVYEAFEHYADDPSVHTIVIDTQTFLMDMFESQNIVGASNTMQGWQDYAQFFMNLMQQHVAKSDKQVIIYAHTRSELNEAKMIMETYVPVKGSLKSNGIESWFSTVVSTKKIPLKKLEGYESELLNITPDDELVGFKYVFQTRLTKETTGERIRSPIGLFSVAQTYMDNDVQMLMDHLKAYYNP